MERKTASDFDQELLNPVRCSTCTAASIAAASSTAPAKFAVGGVTAGDAAGRAEPAVRRGAAGRRRTTRASRRSTVEYPVAAGLRRRCAATWCGRRTATGKLPGVLVVHENRGLNPHIEDIARRLALDDFIAFAPDALAPLGGYPGDEDKARELFAKLDQAKTREDFVAAASSCKARPECTGKVGAVGFCYGGGIVNMLATQLPDLGAGVPFYGSQPAAEDVAEDQGAAADPLRRERRAHQRRLAGLRGGAEGRRTCATTAFIYPGTQHGFNNDTTPRYDEAAAKLAWSARSSSSTSTCALEHASGRRPACPRPGSGPQPALHSANPRLERLLAAILLFRTELSLELWLGQRCGREGMQDKRNQNNRAVRTAPAFGRSAIGGSVLDTVFLDEPAAVARTRSAGAEPSSWISSPTRTRQATPAARRAPWM